MNTITISIAAVRDVQAIMDLANMAYRGEEAKKGWTHEAEIISGTVRTDEASLKELMDRQGSVILKSSDEEGNIIGCVYLEKKEESLYLGMLSVKPELQGGGIGKKLLYAAEEYAREHNCNVIEMTVISIRKELIAWYQRHGYKDIGERSPFPDDGRFGLPVQPIEFIVMKKHL